MTTDPKAAVAVMERAMRSLRRMAAQIQRGALTLSAEAIVAEAQFNSPVAPVLGGTLQGSHGVGSFGRNADGTFANAASISMYANTDYALARHERWPEKPGHQWFLRAIIDQGPRIMQESIQISVQRAAADAARGEGGAAS